MAAGVTQCAHRRGAARSAHHPTAARRVCPRLQRCAAQIPLLTKDTVERKKIRRKGTGMIKRMGKRSGRKRQGLFSLKKTPEGAWDRGLQSEEQHNQLLVVSS